MRHLAFHAVAATALLVILLPGAQAHSGAGQAEPAGTVVVVHGAWGGGWAWREVEGLLREAGYDVYRPTLTGLGERYHLASPEIGLKTHVQDIVSVLEFEDLHDIVLVGHSYGGMVITGVAERVPDRIRHLVYLDALLPIDGECLSSAIGGPPDACDTAEAGVIPGEVSDDGFIVPSWTPPEAPFPKDVPQSARTFHDRIVLGGDPGNGIAASYIITRSEAGAPDSFDLPARRAKDLGWRLYEMVADHNPQWSKPEELATLLETVSGVAGDH